MTPRAFSAAAVSLLLLGACGRGGEGGQTEIAASGQAAIADEESQKTIAGIAAGSADHSTLVAALQAVRYVDPLANPGPFTVFAPTNAAFEKLPAGTVETLLRPENAAKLRTILLHHVTTSAFAPEELTDGMEVGMVDGGPLLVKRAGDAVTIGDALIVASVRGSNGWVHVVDAVLVPPGK
ncbi:MAG TPA: fasciclin domain-containing protein [Gemmatimonadaceae bacterium]